ncbi:MAG TPA: hypothetical protein VKA63_02400, partial [Candidatus Krumholzibacteria bacterium]|nr:hypothetical protein [Candidatus Krumholzibacteria bacterium]
LLIAALRARRDRLQGAESEIRWRGDFQSLPAERRQCRHALNGECVARVCENAFECERCEFHRSLATEFAPLDGPSMASAYGIELPVNRYFHRGHTWLEEQEDGSVLLGMDGFAQRLLAKTDALELPAHGEHLRANDELGRVRCGGHWIRILSPVNGEVIESFGEGPQWRLRVGPDQKPAAAASLLRGSEARAWMQREVESLQSRVALGGPLAALADGGEIVNDLPAVAPDFDWESIWEDYFLEA